MLDIRVSEIVKAYMRQSSVFQNFLMQVHNGIGVIHLPCDGRWEHIWVVGMLLVFGNQQVNSLLWNTDLALATWDGEDKKEARKILASFL